MSKVSRARRLPAQRALDAVALMRREGLSLPAAAEWAGTSRAMVIRHAGPALRRRGDRYVVTAYDHIPREMAFLFADGARWVTVADSRAATLIAEHGNAVRAYRDHAEEGPLRAFRKKSVLMDGERVAFLTDLAAIDRLAEAGELHYELYRR